MEPAPAGGPFGRGGNRAVLYARVSKSDGSQDESGQLQQLATWAGTRGWQVVAAQTDRVTGDAERRRGDPPGLRRALQLLSERKADVLVVFAADRLVRSPIGLLQLVARVQQLGAHVASFQDGADLDTTTDVGELFLFLRGWWARMELRLIRARTLSGMARARAAGKKFGRPRAELGRAGGGAAGLLAGRASGLSWRELGKAAGLPPSTVRRRFQEILSGE